MIKVNGEEFKINGDTNLSELLIQKGYKTTYVAIELNGKIIPREDFSNTVLKDNDTVEIVSFVGGG